MAISTIGDVDDFTGVRDEIVRLRTLGYSLVLISGLTGLSPTRVKSILESEFQDRFSQRDQLKQRAAFELDFLLRPLLERWEKRVDRKDGEFILKICESRRKLFGIDEAIKVEVKEVENFSDEELSIELARHGIKTILEPHGNKPTALPPASKQEHIEDAEVATVELQ